MSAQKQPDKRVLRYLQWYSWRLERRSEDRILRELEERELGEFGTLAALHKQLAHDGFPVCEDCGETPARPGHCQEPKIKRRRPAEPADEATELPPSGSGYAAPQRRSFALGRP